MDREERLLHSIQCSASGHGRYVLAAPLRPSNVPLSFLILHFGTIGRSRTAFFRVALRLFVRAWTPGRLETSRSSRETEFCLDKVISLSIYHTILCSLPSGGGGFAFQLDDELDTGVSGPSDTYGNTRLSSRHVFKCLSIEVWGFGDIHD